MFVNIRPVNEVIDVRQYIINTSLFGTGNKEGTQRYDSVTQLGKDFNYIQKYVNDRMAGKDINWEEVEKYYQTYLDIKEKALEGNEEFKKYYQDFLAGVDINWEEAAKRLQETSQDMTETMSETEQTIADASNTEINPKTSTDNLNMSLDQFNAGLKYIRSNSESFSEAFNIPLDTFNKGLDYMINITDEELATLGAGTVISPVVILDTSEAERQFAQLQSDYSTLSANTIAASYNEGNDRSDSGSGGGVNVNFTQTINSKSPVNAKSVGRAMNFIGKQKALQQLAGGGVLAV